MTMRLPALLAVLFISALFATPALGSLQEKKTSDRPSIPWELDRDGLRQWVKVEVECTDCDEDGKQKCQRCNSICVECNKKHQATCRTCGGRHEQYNPLEEMICPFCVGSGLWQCPACNGKGSYGVVGGSKKGQDCGPCDETGQLKCGVCKGKRRIGAVKPPGGLAKASMKSLDDTTEKLVEAIAALKSLKLRGDESDHRKKFDKAIKKANSYLAGLKSLSKLMDVSMKSLRGQSSYIGYEAWVARELYRMRSRSIAYMESQIVLIQVVRERLEFNESVRKGKN